MGLFGALQGLSVSAHREIASSLRVFVRIRRFELPAKLCFLGLVNTHRLHSSSFLGLPYVILNMNPKKELWRLTMGMLRECGRPLHLESELEGRSCLQEQLNQHRAICQYFTGCAIVRSTAWM